MLTDIFTKLIDGLGAPLLTLIILLSVKSLLEKRDQHKNDLRRIDFNEKVLTRLQNGNTLDLKNIKRIYSSIVNKNYYYLTSWLIELQSEIFKYNYEDIPKDSTKQLERIIDEIEFEEPFSSLPDIEKSLLKDIYEYREKDNNIFQEKIHQLSDVIKTRYDKNTKSHNWNIFLGVLSLILGLIGVIK